MMVGLPGSGKTTWAIKHSKKNPEKKFNILGTNAIMEKMKVRIYPTSPVNQAPLYSTFPQDSLVCLSFQVMGLRRQRNYAGRWDLLISQATQCLNRLIQIAARKKRNYILDQVLSFPRIPPPATFLQHSLQRSLMFLCSLYSTKAPVQTDLLSRFIPLLPYTHLFFLIFGVA